MLDTDKISRLRARLKLTQADAAKAAGFQTGQAWSEIERGKQPNIGLETLEKIAKALKVKPKELLK
jgi:transcriptional regulator with XRE-family HTH domain